jgi:hypothetical protein
MPGARGKRDRLFQEWTQHSGLPEEAVSSLEAESETETDTERVRRPLTGISLNLGRLPEGSWLLIVLGIGAVLSLVNLILLSIAVYVLTNLVK